MKVKYIIYALLIAGLGALIIYRISKSGNPEAGDKKKGDKKGATGGMVPLDGVVVQPTEFSNTLSVTGALEAEQEVRIISQTAGLVTGVRFKEGSNVSKGQVLLVIDDAELKAKLAEATTNEGLARETEKRAALLIKSGAISRQEYDAASANLKSMQAQTQLINAQLYKTLIRAPFSGKIGLTTVAVGKYLAPTDVIANLVSLNPIKISFSVPERYSGRVGINSELQFSLSGSDKKYGAKVFALEPTIDQATRTLQIKARTTNPNGELLPGSFVQVELPISTIHNAILVPSEAIVPIQNGQKVFIAQNGKAKEIKVEGSVRTEKDVLITSGLKAGDTVITSGNMSLKNGSPVKVKVSKTK